MRSLLAVLAVLAGAGAFAQEPPRKKLAGLVVRSEDYAIRRGQDVVEEWTGKVSYRHQGREFYSDWAERRHSDDRFHARGRVRGVWKFKDGTVIEAAGEDAVHDGKKNAGRLTPGAGKLLAFERRAPGLPEPDRGESREMTWDVPAGKLRLEGDVRTWGPSGRSWSDRAEYDLGSKTLALSGSRPVLVSGAAALRADREDWNGAVQAERIEASDRPRRVEAQGRVKGWIVFEDRPAKLKKLR